MVTVLNKEDDFENDHIRAEVNQEKQMKWVEIIVNILCFILLGFVRENPLSGA